MTQLGNNGRREKHDLPQGLLAEIQQVGALLVDIWKMNHDRGDSSVREHQLGTLLAAVLPQLAMLPGHSISRVEQGISTAIWDRSSASYAFLTDAGPEIRQSLVRAPGLNFLLLFHPSGHVREAALDATTGPLPGAFLVGGIRWRMNDWVKPVRLAAKRCADRCFPATAPEIIAGAMGWLSDNEESWGRWQDDHSGDAVLLPSDGSFSLSARPDLIPALAQVMIESTTGPISRRLIHTLRRGPELESQLVGIAAAARQPSVRAAAYRMMLEGRVRWRVGRRPRFFRLHPAHPGIESAIMFRQRELQQTFDRQKTLDACAADPSAAVRKLAVAEIIGQQRYDSHAHDLARRLLADLSPAVRERAEFIITREVQGEVN